MGWDLGNDRVGIQVKGRDCIEREKMEQNCCREGPNWSGGPLCSPDDWTLGSVKGMIRLDGQFTSNSSGD